ncbi:MAG: TonB C-terminal domain-containing protein [Deltaproteobacteria bacterium]|nr:TonB C-terminal domain-containing protein [Deltaproteobacteria bacterium]
MEKIEEIYKKSFRLSLVLHFLFFGFLLLFSNFRGFEPKTKIIWATLPKGVSPIPEDKIKSARELPTTTIQEQKQTAPEAKKSDKKPLTAPKSKAQPKGKAKAKPKPKEKTEVEKAMAALEKKVEAEAAQVKDSGQGYEFGTGTESLRVPLSDPEYVAYQEKIRYKIMREWIVPLVYVEGQETPNASLIVRIDKEGAITETQWQARSDNPVFDTSCLRAVQRSAPLPTPPEKLKWEVYHEGFEVVFDPKLKRE